MTANLCADIESDSFPPLEPVTLEGMEAAPTQSFSTKIAEPHLTDDQLIWYSMYGPPSAAPRQVEDHLTICADCSGEIARLRRLSQVWNDEPRIQQLEYRIRALAASISVVPTTGGLAEA